MLSFLLDAFSGRGAAFMWAITAILAFGVAILLERLWVFFVVWRMDLPRARRAIEEARWEDAIKASGRSPLAAVLRRGVEARNPDSAWEAMSSAGVEAEASCHKRVPYLSTIGNIATMIGLLGNVLGVIVAFGSLGDAAVDERAVHLSEGVATAMATTAYGLLVAIPALAAHAWLEAQAQARMSVIESLSALFTAKLRERAQSKESPSVIAG